MTGADGDGPDLRRFVDDHREVLTRILTAGSAEARAYALTIFAEVGTDEDIKRAKRDLTRIQNGEDPWD